MTNAEFNEPIYELIAMAEKKAAEMREKAENANYIAECEYLVEAAAYDKKAERYRSWLLPER